MASSILKGFITNDGIDRLGNGNQLRVDGALPPTIVARVRCHMCVEFVIGFHRAPRIFTGFFGFLPSTETNISKFQFDQDRGPA